MASYPTINALGVRFQFPIENTRAFLTSKVDQIAGKRYAYYWRASGLRKWTIQYPVLEDAERLTIENFFASVNGRLGEFDFTDPEGNLHPRCRFDMDDLSVEYVGPGQQSVTVVIVELV